MNVPDTLVLRGENGNYQRLWLGYRANTATHCNSLGEFNHHNELSCTASLCRLYWWEICCHIPCYTYPSQHSCWCSIRFYCQALREHFVEWQAWHKTWWLQAFLGLWPLKLATVVAQACWLSCQCLYSAATIVPTTPPRTLLVYLSRSISLGLQQSWWSKLNQLTPLYCRVRILVCLVGIFLHPYVIPPPIPGFVLPFWFALDLFLDKSIHICEIMPVTNVTVQRPMGAHVIIFHLCQIRLMTVQVVPQSGQLTFGRLTLLLDKHGQR